MTNSLATTRYGEDHSLSVETDELVRSLTKTQAILDQLPRAEIDQQDLILETHVRLRTLTTSLIRFLESNKLRLDAGELLSFHVAAARKGSFDRFTQEAIRLLLPHLEERGYEALCTSILGSPWRLYIKKATLSTDSKIKRRRLFFLELQVRSQRSLHSFVGSLKMFVGLLDMGG